MIRDGKLQPVESEEWTEAINHLLISYESSFLEKNSSNPAFTAGYSLLFAISIATTVGNFPGELLQYTN